MNSLFSKTSRGETVAPQRTMDELMAEAAKRPARIVIINAKQATLKDAGRQTQISTADVKKVVAEFKAAGKEIEVVGAESAERMQR